jgi:hypothetical protein
MLEYTKMILKKVSFDLLLFKKELKKAFRWLAPEELLLLKRWCLNTFGEDYQSAVIAVYSQQR